MSRLLWLVFAIMPASGCAIGMGPPTAASRPLLGQAGGEARMWVPAADQSGVPAGMVRIENVADGFARVFNYVSITSAVKKGSASAKLGDMDLGSDETVELDFSVTGRIPLPSLFGVVTFGGGFLMAWESPMDHKFAQSGYGIRTSYAPIGQASIDFTHTWTSGEVVNPAGMGHEVSGGYTSLGGTVLLFGWNSFRWGVSVAKTWTSAGDWSSDGYTYTLVGTMY